MRLPKNANPADPRIWRRDFKARLRETVEMVWSSTNAAITAGVAGKVLYQWLSPKIATTPPAEDLWRICRMGSISLEYLLFGRGQPLESRTMPFALAIGEGEWEWNSEKRHDLGLALAGYLQAVAIHQAEVIRNEDLNRIESNDDGEVSADYADLRREISDAIMRDLQGPLVRAESEVRGVVDAMVDDRIRAQWRAAPRTGRRV